MSILPGVEVKQGTRLNKPLLSAFLLFLCLQVCPMLDNGRDNTTACCSLNQLKSLQASLIASKALLLRCPACADNFAHLHCINTCSPNQSQILRVTKTMDVLTQNFTSTENITREAVVAYQAFLTTTFADGSFDSCKNVRILATGGYAISTMCGSYGAKLCTPQRWLDFQGDSSNGLAPLDIDFNLVEEGNTAGLPEGVVPYNGPTLRCNETTPSGDKACTCQDCKETCPQIPPPQPPIPFTIGGINGFLMISIIVLCSLTVLFILYLFAAYLISSRKTKKVGSTKTKGKDQNGNDVTRLVDPSEVTCTERNSLAAQAFLSRQFSRWGTLMATYPLTVSLTNVQFKFYKPCPKPKDKCQKLADR